MTPMDLHPEDLLEREIRGELSPAEQDRLELHARQCAVCRVERLARADFRQDDESPEAAADVERLLAAMAGPLALQGLSRAPATSVRHLGRYLRFVSVAAAVVSITGLAAASRWTGVRAVVMPWASAPAVVAPVAMAAKAPPSPPVPVRVAAPVTPAVVAPVVDPTPAAEEQAPAPQVAVSVPQPRANVRAARPVHAAVALAPAAPVPPPALASLDDADADPSTMFHRANDAREGGDHLRAGSLYGMLLNRYPSAPEAHASLALFGRMLLDDGNANGALQCFDDYLRKGGALREDVMLGRALAFQRIGPRATADEAHAWTSLLDAYPASVHAERARRRLSELQRL